MSWDDRLADHTPLRHRLLTEAAAGRLLIHSAAHPRFPGDFFRGAVRLSDREQAAARWLLDETLIEEDRQVAWHVHEVRPRRHSQALDVLTMWNHEHGRGA